MAFLLKGLSLFLLGLGVFVLVQVAMPFIAFKAWEVTAYDAEQLLVDPLSSEDKGQVLGVSIQNVNNFPTIVSNNVREAPYKSFKVEIPSIKLEETEVRVNSNEFDLFLGHLPGTALPGEKGNVFVTGHSSLTGMMPKGKQLALLANLPKIKKGDQIKVTALGQRFVYEVVGIKIVDPKEVGVINPPDGYGRYLTLMTCVPPGFNAKRLVVLTKLANT
jgi:LPXTG-site transpeptidase (sortase) family protein